MYPQAATGGSSQAFTGSKASFVALASVTSFSIALLTSIWYSDMSSSTAILGLLAIYLASPEVLMLYWVFSPASVVVDIVRVSATGHVRGRGWLVLFVILQMLSKSAGSYFGYMLHREVKSGEAYAAVAAPSRPGGGGGAGASGNGMGGGGRAADPFAGYAPPPVSPQPAGMNALA